MAQLKRAFRPLTSDQTKLLRWLGDMSAQGWQLKSVRGPGFFRFERQTDERWQYQMELFDARLLPATRSSREAARRKVQFYEELGVQFTATNGEWYFFRAPAGERMALYTDGASRAQYLRWRLMEFVKWMLALALLSLIEGLYLPGWLKQLERGAGAWRWALAVLLGLTAIIFVVLAVWLSVEGAGLWRELRDARREGRG